MEFLNTLSQKFNINLNEQQQKAVTHLNGPALVLAGPGSGKTTVITSRTAYLIMEAGVNPSSILTMTFNKAATLEMEGRFKKIFGATINQEVKFSTLHSFCNLVVKDYEWRQGKKLKRIEGDEETEESKRKIIKKIYKQINETTINEDEMENLISEIGLVKNKMIKELEVQTFSTKNFIEIYKAYEDYKKSNLFIDFDDMLTYAYNILVKCPDILNRYKNKYSYIQVDEGQDLSKIQFEILKLLVRQDENNLFIVADDDQSIYGFRGAEPQYILDMERQYSDCKIYMLENNYRSTKNIVEISSNFIKLNSNRYDKNHRTDNDYKHDPIVVNAKDTHEQLKFIAKTIKEKIKEYKSIAILYRNNLSSITIADVLDRTQIGFTLRQNKLFFFNHWIVLDILAFLKFAINQNDKDSFSRIYFKINRYISKAMAESALNADTKQSLIDTILDSNEIKPFLKRQIIEVKSEFNKLAKMQTIKALNYIENDFNYFDSVRNYCESTGLSYDYLYSLFGILKIIAQEYPNILMFLQRMEVLEGLFSNKKREGYKKETTLTTVHSSKGLEYDCVLMVDLTEDEFPGTHAMELAEFENNHVLLEEERRLFYVGMTRAKEDLYLVSPQTRGNAKVSRSVFIDEALNCKNKKVLNEIGEGMIVSHKQFGEGVISAIHEYGKNRTIIEIDFNGVRRKLDFSTCIESRLLKY